MAGKTKIFGLPRPNTVAARLVTGKRRVAAYRQQVADRFGEMMARGDIPPMRSLFARKIRSLRLSTMTAHVTRSEPPASNTTEPRPPSTRAMPTPKNSLRSARELAVCIEGLACPVVTRGYPSGDNCESLTVGADAWRRVIEEGATCLCINHQFGGDRDDADTILAAMGGQGVRLWTRDGNLYFRARLKDTDLARDTIRRMEAGELRGVSPSFTYDGSSTNGHVSVESCQRLSEISLVFGPYEPGFDGTWANLVHVPVGVSIYSPDFHGYDSGTRLDDAHRMLGQTSRGSAGDDIEPSGCLVGLDDGPHIWTFGG